VALLGTLQLELSAPTDRLSADLDRAQQIIDGQNVTMKRKMGEVSKPLVMSVDDKALTALNKHLTLKQEHYKTVQEEFAKPIKIGTTRVDTRELDNLDRRVEKYKKEDYFKFRISGGTTPSSFEGIRNQVSRLVLSPIAVPIKVLQSGINSFARGIFEGLTRDISRSFTQSFANTTNKFIERKTGKSMIQMGKEAGSYTSKNAYLWAEYVSRAQGYEGGLKGVGTQVKEIGN
jgi:DNA polymerase sigma